MKFIILLAVFITAAVSKKCPGVFFNSQYYDIQLLKDGANKIHQIVLNRAENTLYFTFDQISTDIVPTRVLGFLNIDTKEAGVIEGIRNATAVTVDNFYNLVYVGGSDGIYRINSRKVPESIPIRDSIQSVFYKEYLFYTNSRNEAFVYQNGYINNVFELQGVAAQDIILDDDNNIFFTQGKTLFRVKIGTRAVNTHEKYKVDVLTVDTYSKPYIGTKDGVYVYNKYKYVLDRVSNLSGLKALTFSKTNEPIYVVYDMIIKLNLNATKCIEQ